MKQNNKNNKVKTDAANRAKSTREGKAITADRATKADQPASKSHLLKLKKLFLAWMEARESGAAEALLETGSEWQQLLQAAGLSVIDGQADIASDARAAAETVAARYAAAKTTRERKPLQVVVDVITQDGMQPVGVEDAMQPLLADIDPAQAWQDYSTNVRPVPTRACKLADVLPYVSARDVLTVEQIAARLPEDRRKGAAEVQRKVKSILLAKSKAYAAYAASDLQAVKTRGSQVVHVVNVTYTDGAKGKAQ